MIELRNLERSYKTGHTETWVLRRINLTIHEGEFVTIMGPLEAQANLLTPKYCVLNDKSAKRNSISRTRRFTRWAQAESRAGAETDQGWSSRAYHLLE